MAFFENALERATALAATCGWLADAARQPDFPDLAALNAWLEQRCTALWHETGQGTLPGTIADVWAEERAALMPWPVAFDGFIELRERVSPTCLIRFERNHYSVPASLANRPVSCGSIRSGWSWRRKGTSCANIPV